MKVRSLQCQVAPTRVQTSTAGVAHCDFGVGLVVAYFYGPASIWHTRCHYACFEMILSAFLDLFTHKLVLVTSPLFGVEFVFGCLFRFLFVVLFLGVFPGFLAERDSYRNMHRSSTSLLLRPLQEWPLRDLIKLLIPIATCSQTC